jgi:dihydropteroate synthase
MALPAWHLGNGKSVSLDRPAIIAILNITPDSFSDGGDLSDPALAADAAAAAVADGAAMLDVGGESTRPGAQRVSAAEQIRRVVPVVREVRRRGISVPISVDTTHASVAAASIDAGADAVNDVSAGTEDPAMLALVAARGVGVVLMHRRVAPARDQFSDQYASSPVYPGGVTKVVCEFLIDRAAAAQQAGVPTSGIVVDPGLGFGKSVEQNLELIRDTSSLVSLGFPVLSALSRKSFTARTAGLGPDTPPKSRLHATLGLSVAHFRAGARLFRVHDVAPHRDALNAAHSV